MGVGKPSPSNDHAVTKAWGGEYERCQARAPIRPTIDCWMARPEGRLWRRLDLVHGLRVETGSPLKVHSLIAVGGPADLFAWAETPQALGTAFLCARDAGVPLYLLGTGAMSRHRMPAPGAWYFAHGFECRDGVIEPEAGGCLQALVDVSIDNGLEGVHRLSRVPSSVGGAVYGNTGAFGHQIDKFRQARGFP